MSRKRLARALVKSDRLEEYEFSKLTCGEPREAVVGSNPAKRESPVAIEPVPTKYGRFHPDAGHRLHRVARDFSNVSDGDHGIILCPKLARTGTIISFQDTSRTTRCLLAQRRAASLVRLARAVGAAERSCASARLAPSAHCRDRKSTRLNSSHGY